MGRKQSVTWNPMNRVSSVIVIVIVIVNVFDKAPRTTQIDIDKEPSQTFLQPDKVQIVLEGTRRYPKVQICSAKLFCLYMIFLFLYSVSSYFLVSYKGDCLCLVVM